MAGWRNTEPSGGTGIEERKHGEILVLRLQSIEQDIVGNDNLAGSVSLCPNHVILFPQYVQGGVLCQQCVHLHDNFRLRFRICRKNRQLPEIVRVDIHIIVLTRIPVVEQRRIEESQNVLQIIRWVLDNNVVEVIATSRRFKARLRIYRVSNFDDPKNFCSLWR